MKVFLIIFILSCFIILPAHAAEIATVSWEKLSDRDISPYGKLALSLDEKSWRHSQTSHFCYHFADEKKAETVYIHAEVYYNWIKEIFGVKEDKWAKKNHIFVFTDENAWNDFKTKARLRISGDAFTDGWELFIYRQPYWLNPRRSLAHEMTHIIMFRFLDGPLPLFLNEGFAEFVAFRALAMQLRESEYKIRPLQLIQEKEYIPLNELIGMGSYPEDRLEVFYKESELLVRFLILKLDKEKFYKLLRRVSKGDEFEKSLKEVYGIDIKTFEESFKGYALSKT